MKITNLFESVAGYTVKEVNKSDMPKLQDYCKLYNQSGQLSWDITPVRLLAKIGGNGVLFALFYDGEMVGTIGLKNETKLIEDGRVAEIGYLWVEPEHRSFTNVMALHRPVLLKASDFDMVFATTNSKNKQISTLLKRTPNFRFAFTAKSPFLGSSNVLNYWVCTNSTQSTTEQIKTLTGAYGDNIMNPLIRESVEDLDMSLDLLESVSYPTYVGEPLETGGTSIAGNAAPPVRELLKNGSIKTGMKVLDYGCGKFLRNASFLRENGVEVYAYDPFNQGSKDGWEFGSNKLPRGVKFDVVFSAYVLNVVPQKIEQHIIHETQMLGKHVYHITRNMDIFDTTVKALNRMDKVVSGFFLNEYLPSLHVTERDRLRLALEDDTLTKEDIIKFCMFGVQTSRGFQRIPMLEEYGFRVARKTSGFKVYKK